MALLFMEGWDWQEVSDYGAITRDSRCLSSYTNSTYVRTETGGRLTGNRLRVGSLSASYVHYQFPVSNDTYYIGMAILVATPESANIMSVMDGATIQNSLYLGSLGEMQIRTGTSTVLGTTSTGLVPVNEWCYVVMKVKISNTVGTAELWIDGVKELDLTSQDTQASANAQVNAFYLYELNGQYMRYDDMYIGDTTGTDMTDQQGDCHIEMVSPDVDGTTNNWTRLSGTNNYEMVDEGQTDNDTTYVYSSTLNDKELYGCGALTIGGTIKAVQVQVHAKKEDPGYRQLKPVCRSSVTEVEGTIFPLTTSYASGFHTYENDPNGGIDWTESAVNAMEIGFKITS